MMPEVPLRLSQALYWMNTHLSLIAYNSAALTRMRLLASRAPGGAARYQADTSLLVRELAREKRRLTYWNGRVDQLRGADLMTGAELTVS
jgi:hypothetical protein